MKNIIIRILGVYLDTLSVISPQLAARKGFLLFCRPFRVPASQKHLSFLRSAEQFQIDHEGYAVQGYRWGVGPKKVLFLHGWQSHTYRWKPYIEGLSKDEYTIFSLDAPGHGLSSGNFLTVPLYSSLIEKFIRQQAGLHSIIGHSLGGFSLLYTLYREPALPVERAILLAPPGEASDFISTFKKTLGVSDRTINLIVDHFAQRYQVPPDFFSARKFASRVNVKGLIIHDEDDTEAPYHYSIPLQEAWHESRLITTTGYGHNLKSTSVVKEVIEFIGASVHHHTVL